MTTAEPLERAKSEEELRAWLEDCQAENPERRKFFTKDGRDLTVSEYCLWSLALYGDPEEGIGNVEGCSVDPSPTEMDKCYGENNPCEEFKFTPYKKGEVRNVQR